MAVEHGHSEFYNYIEKFPGQEKFVAEAEALDRELPLRERKLDYLREELRELAREPQRLQNYVCYRTCFKQKQRGLIEFCLDRKCKGASFSAAAAELGLLKP